jgi:ubiquinone biosynthesis protein
MDLLKTGLEFSKVLRHVGRLREILLVFAKHGFEEVVNLPILSKIPGLIIPKSKRIYQEKRGQNVHEALGFRLRNCFEELGTTFIKFGQLLGTREDMFHPDFIAQMRLLRDKVNPVPFSQYRDFIEQSYEKPIDEIFRSVTDRPIGSASIGVVYQGELHNGKKVVLKVRRPGIEKEIERDFELLMFLLNQMEKRIADFKFLGLSRILNDFSLDLKNETNFNIEANNGINLGVVLKKYDQENFFYIPKIYKELSRENILIMEFIEGIPFIGKDNLTKIKGLIGDKLEDMIIIFIKTLLQEGFFHADLHGGNFFLTKQGKVALIDFGLMGRISYGAKINLLAIIHALITFDYENIVFEFLDVAEYESIPDLDKLTGDVHKALMPFIGLSTLEISFSALLKSVIKVLKQHKLYLPLEWPTLFRALMTLEGMGRELEINSLILPIIERELKSIFRESLDKQKISSEAVLIAKDLISYSRILPRHLKWFLREWARKKYALEILHKGHEKQFEKLAGGFHFLSMAILSGIFLASGVFQLGNKQISSFDQIPVSSWIFWAMSFLFFFWGRRGL